MLTTMAYVDLNPIRARLATVPEDSAEPHSDTHSVRHEVARLFSTAIGTPEHLTAHCVARNVAFLRGMGTARVLFERQAA